MADGVVEILTIVGRAFLYLGIALIALSLGLIFYPILSGKICSWNAPCGLKEGYDCKTCTVRKDKSTSIAEVILELLTFGACRPSGKNTEEKKE